MNSIYLGYTVGVYYTGKPSQLFDEKSIDWAPSINLGHGGAPIVSLSSDRYDRAVRRDKNKRRRTEAEEICTVSMTATPGTQTFTVCESVAVSTTATPGTQTVLTMNEVESLVKSEAHHTKEIEELQQRCAQLEQDNARLRAEKQELKEKITVLNEDFFKDNDEKVRFYTGLTNWNLLLIVIQFVQPFLNTCNRSMLSAFQQVVLTLIRLRLGLSGQDLGYRFGIHQSTVSRVFTTVIDVLYKRLKHLIIWPERDVLRRTLPMDFRKHCPNCVVIIDCFEIFVDRPSALLARAQTYSSYKHHNTAKYLIGITPHGIVSFKSNGWGGRVSDKNLTENCGLLNKLLPGDTVLADRGFDIKDSVGLFCATVTLPAYTRGKKQLSGIEVEQTRRIANVRIHVERVIGNVRKKYSLLGMCQPIDFLSRKSNEDVTTLDKIVTVACSLNNLCNSVVPTD